MARGLFLFVVLFSLARGAAGADPPDYQREVRPILAEFCFRCHGLDENAVQGDLRLDRFNEATRQLPSGRTAIVPGLPNASEVIARIGSDDDLVRMPPPEVGKRLTSKQLTTIREWIVSGAEYADHWAFARPVAQPTPPIRDVNWPKNFIDAFILNRLEREGLRPNPEANPERLLRRVSLDLVGVPPGPDEIDAFLEHWSRDPESAYQSTVDRLLHSVHFGERMAIDWLDAARYADTNGYFGDRARQAWPWRDWVIRAFNRNQPFDEFTLEQIAGDLLPNATRDQIVATGFQRNSMANNETGIIDEEFRVEAVADRVDTMATVWMGLTVGCAQCHNHKYDPISQREYYQLFAYFNSADETGLVTQDSPPPKLDVPNDQQLATLDAKTRERSRLEKAFEPLAAELERQLADWESMLPTRLTPPPTDAVVRVDFDEPDLQDRVIGTSLQTERGIRGLGGKLDATQHLESNTPWNVDGPWSVSVWVKPTGSLNGVWSKIEPTERRRGVELVWQKGRLQLNLVHHWGSNEILLATRDAMTAGNWHHLMIAYDGSRRAQGLKIFIDGKPAGVHIIRDTLCGSAACAEPLRIGRRDSGLGFYGLMDEFRILDRSVDAQECERWTDAEQLLGVHARAKEDRSAAELSVLKEHFIQHEADIVVRTAYEQLQTARQSEKLVRASIPTALVMKERESPRKTHLLVRGQYDVLGEEVKPAIPRTLPASTTDLSPDRLGLARWLVSREHPLTARVAVNRFWQLGFGEGLVRTPNDFGTQGEPPTHPDLLDELSVRWMECGWDVKQLLRWIVTSATYRQSSHADSESLLRDPENRLLSRGPRFRLSAELVRDQALAVSGLWATAIGGPSVRPYQPDGLWESVSYNGEESYQPDRGENQWRRTLYTYWKRQAPPPALQTFDAPTREKCSIRRPRTNTPLQALVLLNDPTYMEAAKALMIKATAKHSDTEARARWIFRRVLSRWPDSGELQLILELLERELADYRRHPERAAALLGDTAVVDSLPLNEAAAWMLVAHTILNLDEAITRR